MSFFNNHLQKKIAKVLESLVSCPHLNRSDVDEHWLQLNTLQSLSQIQIDDIDYKGVPSPLDESITIRNRGSLTVHIGGWCIQAGSPKQAYTFPEDAYLSANEILRIDTSGQTEHSFHSNRPIWNNKGDIGTLIDDQGQTISSLAYGNSAHRKIIIGHMNFDGKEHRSEGDEYVEISNISDDDVMLSEWRLEAETNNSVFIFPKHTKLEAYNSLKIFTNKADLQRNEYSFNSPKAIWNNTTGGCKLLDYLDNHISSYHY